MTTRGDLLRMWEEREGELHQLGQFRLTQTEMLQLLTTTMLYLLRNGRFMSYDYKVSSPYDLSKGGGLADLANSSRR